MKKSILSILIAGLVFTACQSRRSISGYYNYETECLGKSATGIQTLRTWGTGSNVREAQIKAYQEALNDILFKGIRNGNSECELIPLVPEANAREKYAAYFDEFFSSNGHYRDFVRLSENKQFKRSERSNHKEAFAYVLEVNLPALKEQLRNDKILK